MDERVKPAHDELCELLRLTRKEEVTPLVRQTNPTGKSVRQAREQLSSPSRRNISLSRPGKSVV
jgi:hypothetical protein